MRRRAPAARVFLLLALCQWSLCAHVRRDVLRVREEMRSAERILPQLRLHPTPLQQDVCVRVWLYVHPLLANETLKIEFRWSDSETGDSDALLLFVWKQNSFLQWNTSDDLMFQPHKTRIQTREMNRTSQQTFWILQYRCFPARSGSTVSVSVRNDSDVLLISQSQFIETADDDPVPQARVAVDHHEKRFTVQLETDQIVKISLCYKHSNPECVELKYYGEIDPSVSPAVDLSFPYLIPCVCVQLWFTDPDARRNTQCPLKERILPHGGDILSSSSARVLGSVLQWEPLCPDDQSDPSVSLCWQIHMQKSYCVPAPNATLYDTKLEREDLTHIRSRAVAKEYNVSAVDKHPQMCVKFSLNGSHRVFCPFKSEGRSEWSVTVVPGSLRLHVRLTSKITASFAAQLCVRDKKTCASRGHVMSCQLDGGATEAELSLPFLFLSSGLCVQVWRVDLHGRRVICPDFTHRRWGLIIGAALTLLSTVTVLVCITRWLLKKPTSELRIAERRPVLLVCSSTDATHISAVCSLASGLQGELCMDVRLAQWMQCHPQSSLAQLGPVPWLYGQCQDVQKAGGLVLIAWSPDAHQAYLRWRKSERQAGLYSAVEDEEEEQMCCDEECMEKPMESCSITAPVFSAALSCLCMGIRRDGHGQGFGLVCFQSACIPKRLQCVRNYCLPKDLCSLIHNLTGTGDRTGQTRGRCWPRLLSKALSFFVSRQLAQRLEAKLPAPTDTPKLIPSFSRKLTSRTKRKTWRQKKRRSKVVPSCLSRKQCSKKRPAAEPLRPLDS